MGRVSDGEFSEFVQGAWPGLYRTAYLLVGDAGLAEDLVQTALAKTYAAWPSIRDVRAAPGFARTTLVNTATSWFRRHSWRNELPTETLPDAGHDTDPSDGPQSWTRWHSCRRASVPWWCCGTTRTSRWRRRPGARMLRGDREEPDLQSSQHLARAARRRRRPRHLDLRRLP